MTVWERLRNPCGWRAGAKQISVDAMLPLLVVPILAVIAAQTVLCTTIVFLATPFLVYYLHHNFLRFLLRTKFFLMWTITSVLMLMLVFELSVVPLLEIMPEENFLFIVCVVGGIWCGYKAKLNADYAAQEGAVTVQGLELGEGSGELCATCRRRAPPKAYHCRLCQICILNREYHCKWLDCCIGSNNLRWYLGCLFFSAIAFIYGSNLTMTSVCHPFILIGTVLLPDDCSDVYHQLEHGRQNIRLLWCDTRRKMDPRGPPEGAPAESFEISSIDKGADTSVNWPIDHAFASLCEQPKKLNNRLLFLTVEYVEDQSRLFPTYEQISLSPRAASPLSEFEHRVSPLDPNMSSAARYSPTPVQLPSSPFHNSVVVLHGPSSPLISQPEPNIRTSINYVTQLTHPIDAQVVPQTDATADFVGNGNEEGLVSSVSSELILMQETTPELESSATPLMLTGIPGTDFTLTRDFLVMQDDQINVINTFKNQNMEIENSHVALSSVIEDANKENNNLIIPECDKGIQQITKNISPSEKKKSIEKKDVRRSKRHITDKKNLWCDEYDNNCTKDDSCNLNDVCTIADQPVPSRAVATLPGSYLSLNKLSTSQATAGVTYGVFAKRYIRRRTQFGPIEGVLCTYDGSSFEDALPLLYETENGELFQVDVSNENTSNWMRFVRPALTYKEQNLIICQQKDGIVFLTNRNISPKEELKAGPSADYASRRNLSIFKPDEKEVANQISIWPRLDGNSYNNRRVKMFCGRNMKEKENSRQNNKCNKEWKCSVCNLIFRKPSLLNLHTTVHSSNDIKIENQTSACPQCGLEFQKQSELVNHVSQHGRSALPKTKRLTPLSTYKCSMCYKRFATKIRLQQHCLAHGAEDQKPLPCSICLKRFMNNSALSGHLKTHKENKQVFECPMCRQLFRQGTMLKDHVETHRNQDGIFSCPHCQRTFIKYSVIRKHIRAHHCERKHKCQHCAKRFPTVDKLRMHLLKHSDHREFHCANCGKQFKRKDKLKEHMTKIHHSQTINGEQMTQSNQAKKFVPKVNPNDYNRFIYKCHQCLVGFKRRGMLVNHLAKRHPDVAPESVPELNLPILRQTRDYYCQYCDKVYKSSSKRKAHIMKNHPGAALPPSNRQKESEFSGLPNPSFSQTVGSVTTSPQGCQWCHKQYASKAKLLQHQRKKHAHLMEPADQIPRSRNRPPQNQNQPPALNDNNFVISDYIQGCDVNGDFLKQKIIKITNDVDLIGNGGLEMVGQQFVRMRDIR